MKLREAFNIQPGEVVSLVGGGGKTTLMFALAHELAASQGCVITTTTTKILEPGAGETPLLLLDTDETGLIEKLVRNMARYPHITMARERLASGKLNGVSPELVVRLARLKLVPHIIVEADGAAHRSLKAPSTYEPVLPPNTSLVIPIVGIDVLGQPLTEKYVFRAEIAARLLGLTIGSTITTEAIANLVTHPHGLVKGSPVGARIIPFINKMDLDPDLSKGRQLARQILAMGTPRIKQVVLGQARSPEPVVEVIRAGK